MIRKALILAVLLAGAPAVAQQATIDQRVAKVEKELRAVQRKVFPGGSAQFFDPEITPQAAPPAPAGTPSGGELSDLSARVDTLEQELQRLTAQSEQNGYQLRQLQDQFNQFKAQADAARAAPPPAVVPTPDGAGADGDAEPANPFAGQQAAAPRPADRAPPPPAAVPPASTPVEPAAPASTGDPAEDGYLAGYRQWEAKQYPQAIATLQQVVTRYPKHRRASFAQNLIGRSYLDDGKPALAAKAFYANYQNMPRGERAPDSLYFLGQALTQLKKPAEACKVYGELDDVYGPTVTEPLKSRIARGKIDAKCGG